MLPITEPPLPDSSSARARAGDIRRMKARATALLLVVTAMFLATVVLTDGDGASGYLRAALEAGMVGGLADWFAVTAIFRHPLGIPIPHTAVIVRRKDAFGQTLGDFVQEHFLSAEQLRAQVEAIGPSTRAARWALEPGNADRVAGHVAGVAVRLADAIRDDEVLHMAERELRTRVERLDVAPLAGRLLRIATEDGRHRELVDSVLHGLDQFLAENEQLLRDRFGQETPWWLPEVIDDRIFQRLVSGVRSILAGDTVGGQDELRDRLDASVVRVIDRLQHDPVWARRAEELTQDLLDHPELRRFLAEIWDDVKESVRVQAGDDSSILRARLAAAIRTGVRRFQQDPALVEQADRLVVSAAGAVANEFRDEIRELVASTIRRWDGRETADRMELLLGRDLQFIRINGTLVGALAGTVIHGIAELAG